ncbi:hypothetical protein KUCAC02_030962 [Chaenocephalus aceratus]|uniref:Uncharacterized protein n=1 Tax=Chaenocephalus aceratus TaxID=36190 RepID=A0ACB9XKB1_CHAAC|nr:hypothetical protein KUCAC02_030962 [Chaenocephalus aceratus]
MDLQHKLEVASKRLQPPPSHMSTQAPEDLPELPLKKSPGLLDFPTSCLVMSRKSQKQKLQEQISVSQLRRRDRSKEQEEKCTRCRDPREQGEPWRSPKGSR